MVIITKLALPSHQHYLNPFMIKLRRKALTSLQNPLFGRRTTFRQIFPPNKLQCLSRGDSRNLCANTRVRILSRERSSRDRPGSTNGFNKSKTNHPKKQRARSDFFASSNLLPKISVVRPVSEISHTTTCLFAHFMKTPKIYFYCELQFVM